MSPPSAQQFLTKFLATLTLFYQVKVFENLGDNKNNIAFGNIIHEPTKI